MSENYVPREASRLYNRLHRDDLEYLQDLASDSQPNRPVEWRDDLGALVRREWRWDGRLHRDDGPALEGYDNFRGIWLVGWYQRGQLHRDDGPAEVTYQPYGQPLQSPADHPSECPLLLAWYQRGQLHREDGPALEQYYFDGCLSDRVWYQRGQLHRDDGPASESFWPNAQPRSAFWFRYGVRHCDDGPAWLRWHPNMVVAERSWWQNGQLYRPDGCPRECYDDNGNPIPWKRRHFDCV